MWEMLLFGTYDNRIVSGVSAGISSLNETARMIPYLLIRFKTADRTICIAIIYRKGNRPISLAIRKGEFSQEILTVRVWQA